MKIIKSLIDTLSSKKILSQKKTIIVKDKYTLKDLIFKEINLHGNTCDLNHLDVSQVTDMSYLFCQSDFPHDNISIFNGDISQWDVSNVTDMNTMFYCSKFKGDISRWDTSNVAIMSYMFEHSLFNGDISGWNVANVTDMMGMFRNSIFNQDISQWDVSNLKVTKQMFSHSMFTGDLTAWRPCVLYYKEDMFSDCMAPVPYWYEFDDVGQSIQKIQLKEKLENTLSDNVNVKPRVKI